MVYKPSFFKIIANDYIAFLGMAAPPIFWAYYLYRLFTNNLPAAHWSLLAFFGAVTLACLMVLLWRVSRVESVFEHGCESQAVITSIYFEKDRGRIEYIYQYEEVEYKSGTAVMKSNQTKFLRVGEPVIVLVDRNNPRRAYLRDLYLSEPVAEPAPLKKAGEPGVCVPFQGEFDRQAFFQAAGLAFRPSKREMIWRIGLAALLLAILAAAYHYEGQAPQLSELSWLRHIVRPALTVFIGLAAVLQPFFSASLIARKLWKDPARQPRLVGEIDKQGICYQTGPGEAQFVPWSKCIKIRLDYQMFALVTAEGALHAFPRSFFQNDIQWLIAAILAKGYVRPAAYA